MIDSTLLSVSRRRLLQALTVTPLLACSANVPARGPGEWLQWKVLRESSMSADGRLIDHNNADQRSTSEGQSYALFFALVDNDPALFERILGWTQANLAGGDMASRLPAWWWGRDPVTGAWQVRDDNPASDSDLWLAYTLLEAARLWQRPQLQQLGESMLALIHTQEVVEVPGLGTVLLPGPYGFASDDTWRLNPSYLPLPLLRRLATLFPAGPWPALLESSVRVVRETAPHGFAPDWTAWRAGAFIADPEKGAVGSYDAIRCYLWAGMTHADDPDRPALLSALSGPLNSLRAGGHMPEKVDSSSGRSQGRGNYGFDAALLPYLIAKGEPGRARALAAGLPTPAQLRATAPNYYAQVLGLFAQGWYENRYRFAADGRLQPAWG